MATGSSGGPGNLRNPVIPGKKVKLVDEQLVIQDFVNALNIPQGSKVGQPSYGTTLWTFVFEPNTQDVQQQLQNEVRRVASLDPRLILNTVNGFPQENGILIEVELAIAPFNNPTVLNVYFDNLTNTASVR
jgi:phage baseplate assembly protein W